MVQTDSAAEAVKIRPSYEAFVVSLIVLSLINSILVLLRSAIQPGTASGQRCRLGDHRERLKTSVGRWELRGPAQLRSTLKGVTNEQQ
jgi:hypothetical protein